MTAIDIDLDETDFRIDDLDDPPAQSPATATAAPSPPGGSTSARNRPSRAKGTAERHQVRRTAEKVLAINDAPDDHRRLLAGLLGCPDEPVALATEVLCTTRAAGVVTDLQEVCAADPMEAGVLVASWERARSVALWNLLVQLGSLRGTRPPHDAKAAIALARAALGLSEPDRARVAAVSALARRS